LRNKRTKILRSASHNLLAGGFHRLLGNTPNRRVPFQLGGEFSLMTEGPLFRRDAIAIFRHCRAGKPQTA